jgi:hypothetical protein
MICSSCKSETRFYKDALCGACRLRTHQVVKYPWTPEMDAELTRIYRTAAGKTELSRNLTALANRHRRPRYIVQNRAQTLNLRTRIQRNWDAVEFLYLRENAGTLSIARMAQHLGRSPSAVKYMLFQRGLSGMVTEGYSQHELAGLFGVHHNKVGQWIAKSWLFLDSNGRISHHSVCKFAWAHMPEYRLAAAEDWWLKSVLNPQLHHQAVTMKERAA